MKIIVNAGEFTGTFEAADDAPFCDVLGMFITASRVGNYSTDEIGATFADLIDWVDNTSEEDESVVSDDESAVSEQENPLPEDTTLQELMDLLESIGDDGEVGKG